MSDMEPKEQQDHSAERRAVPDDSAVQDTEQAQVSCEAEDEPAVIEFAGQVREALAPVRAPESVRDKLRVELLDVAQHRRYQDVRIEAPPRRREWAIGAVVALLGGALYLLHNRLQGPSPSDSRSQAAKSK